MTIKATAASTGGELFLMETRLPAGFSPPLHVHHDEHEAFYVLEGELDIVCGSERYNAAAGAFAFLPSGIAHTFRVVGRTRVLTMPCRAASRASSAASGGPRKGPGCRRPARSTSTRSSRSPRASTPRFVGPPLGPS